MDDKEMRDILKELDITQRQLSRDIDTDVTVVNRWATGKARIPGAAAAYLRLRLDLEKLTKGSRR